jgi:hypothetical protein
MSVCDPQHWTAGDVIDVSAIGAFTFVGGTTDPGAGQLGYHYAGADTIVVGNTGATTLARQRCGGRRIKRAKWPM